MLIFVIAGILTLLLGVFMFAYLSKYSDKTYPVGLADSIGDGFFLVLFNAYAFSYGLLDYLTINPMLTLSLLSLSLLFGIGIMVWRKDYSNYNDWSRPAKGHFNVGGYYHSVYLTIQAFIILFSLVLFNSIMLYVLFLGYLVTLILHEFYVKRM